MTTTTDKLPILSYPVKDYWRTYTLTLPGCQGECTGECSYCNEARAYCLLSRGFGKHRLPEAVRGMISAESRDWLLASSRSVRKSLWQVLAGCECDPDFVSRKIAEVHTEGWSGGNYWALFQGLCHNVHMDRDCQLRFAHDVMFAGRKEITSRDEIESTLGLQQQLHTVGLPDRVLEQRGFDSYHVLEGLRAGGLNHPDVLKALLSPDGSGFGPGLSNEVMLLTHVLEPFDRLLENWSPGLSAKLPLGLRSALMHCRFDQVHLFLDLMLVGDVAGPVPVRALQGVMDLVSATRPKNRKEPSDDLERGMQNRLYLVLGSTQMVPHGSMPRTCTTRRIRLKLELRKGELYKATERLAVASKSWGKISVRDRKKWLEIPVTADPNWVRKEPLHA